MQYRVINKQDVSEQLLPMEDITFFVRALDPEHEQTLEILRYAAIDACERMTNRLIGINTVQLSIDTYRPRIQLPLGDVHTIESITARDSNGEVITLAATEYRLNTISGELFISSNNSRLKDFVITYQVGYSVESVPHVLKIGILKLIAHWFDVGREDVIVGVSVSDIPFNHRACFDLYRLPNLV
ncbi:hypothetical protein WN238_001482 [Vibrio parahaemolyticus]